MDMAEKRRIQSLCEKLKLKEQMHNDDLRNIEADHRGEIIKTKTETTLKVENEMLKSVMRSGGSGGKRDTSPKKSKAPTLSVVIDEFMSEYDPAKKPMLAKHKTNLARALLPQLVISLLTK